jgi:hypothetical protein
MPERKWRKNFRKDPKPKKVFVRLGKFGPVLKLEKRMMKRKICQFNGRSKYRNYYIGRALDLFCFRKI